MGKKYFCNCLVPLCVPRPASSPPPTGGGLSLCRPSGRLCICEAHFRHRGAPVSGFLRPSATVAAWQPGPAARSGGRHRFRRALPPPVQARRFAATFPVPPPPTFIHARRTGLVQRFLPIPSASTAPASFRADPDHASSFSPPKNCSKKQPPPEIPGSGRCRSTFQAVFSS